MATSYPSGIDALSNPAGSDALSTGHASQHTNANDAIEAIETELGTDPSGAAATVKARFEAIEADSWVTSARIADGTITGTDIASGTVTSTNILDGTIVNADINASAAIDVSKLSGVVSSASVGNLLTANQASVETDTTGFSSIAGCTIARSTAQAKVGSASLLVTSTTGASGGGAAGTPRATSGRAVTPGVTYTGIASVLNGVGTRTLQLRLLWWDGAGTFISTADGQTATPATWTTLYAAGVAPANAAYVSVEVNMTTVGSIGDTYYLDCLGFWQGAGGLWALPGTPIADLGTYTDESVGRRIFTWDTVNSRWQMTYGDTGQRTAGSSLGSGWTATYDLISRVGGLITANIILVKSGSNTVANGETLLTLPAGFRPQTTTYNVLGILSGVSGTTVFQLATTGALTYFGATTGTITNPTAYLTFTFRTADAWPSSLPGSASGSIPT